MRIFLRDYRAGRDGMPEVGLRRKIDATGKDVVDWWQIDAKADVSMALFLVDDIARPPKEARKYMDELGKNGIGVLIAENAGFERWLAAEQNRQNEFFQLKRDFNRACSRTRLYG